MDDFNCREADDTHGYGDDSKRERCNKTPNLASIKL
jgi:hypothetical protein